MKTLSAVCALLIIGITLMPGKPAGALERTVRSGTGFFVSKSGHLLTNFHVVDSCRQLTIQSGHLTGTAGIVALDPANDLALLATNLKPARIADWRYAVRDGEPVVFYGFPPGADRAANGTVLGLTGWQNNRLLFLEAGLEPGMSGSAIVDRGGRVIGISVGYFGLRIGRATASAAAAALLDAHGVTHPEGGEAKPLAIPAVIEKAKAISAKVICDSNGRATDLGVCTRAGGISAPDDMIIDACSRAIAAGKIGGEQLRSMYSQRADARLRKRQYDLAKSDCDDALKIAPDDSDTFRCRARIYVAKGEHDNAIAELNEALHHFQKDTIAFYMRAGAYLAKGDVGRAMTDIDQAIAIDSAFASAIRLRGTIFEKMHEHVRAVADFDRAIAIYDEWIKLYALAVIRAAFLTQRGNVYNAKGDRDRAIADYSEAIRLDPKFANAYNNRGLAYRAKRDNDRAIADFSEAIAADPKLASAYNNRGNAYRAKGDNDRAIADHSEAIRLDPKFANAYNNRGLAYRAKGDNDRAIADFSEAIAADPKLASAYNNRGNAYSAKSDLDRAIADYDEAIRGDPKFANAYINRGLAFLYGGSLAKAQADFKQTNDLNPKYAYAALWLDLAERRNNIPSHLAEAAKQLDMKAWPAPVVRLFLGELSPAQTLAAADDENPKTKQQQVCEANFYNGELSLLQGAKEEALRLFHLAANDCPRAFREWTAANAELKALGMKP